MWVWVQLAGGSGTRMGGGDPPKQLRRLGRKPLFAYAIETFLTLAPESPVITVLPTQYFSTGKRLLQKYFSKAQLFFTLGGTTRSSSTEAALDVLEQLELLRPPHVVAFHDAARPFASAALLRRTFETAAEKGAAVCGLPVPFSIRQRIGEHSQALPRENLWEVQTPQAFRGEVLAQARHRLAPTASPHFTDEGSWIEAAGWPITLVAGEPTNLKITYPIDWEVAKALLRRQKENPSAS